jgi:hypothetical protein
MVPNRNDGSGRAPRLRIEFNLGTLNELPEWSTGPKLDLPDLYEVLKTHGFEAIQGGDNEKARAAGLDVTGFGWIGSADQTQQFARQWKDEGHTCVTLHVGNNFMPDDEMARIAEGIVAASSETGLPLFVETHRATMTQDVYRTLRLVERVPGLRFNGDFSHWYTGHEMNYGPVEEKLERMQPVLERTRYIHGRISSPGSIQVPIRDGSPEYVAHFRTMWTRAFRGFLASAKPGDIFGFAPEILGPPNYARLFRQTDGELREETDRWQEAQKMIEIAKECFAEAERPVGSAA